MIAPRGLVGTALAAWGWAIGTPALGIGLGILFEALRFTALRMTLSELAFARLMRVTFIVAIAAFAYSIATQRAPQSLYAWLRWLPVLLLPIPFLQVGGGGTLTTSSLRQSLRFGGKPLAPDPRPWDATHAYALCCLLAIGTAGSAEPWYYPFAFALIAWALVAGMRARRAAGIALLACASALGLGVSAGLYRFQAQLEEWGEEFFEDMFSAEADPFRERTRIGDMGRIKLNDRILMRVAPEGPRPTQILLREAAFDRYGNGAWESSRRTLRAVPREGDRWRLAVRPRGPTPGSHSSLVLRRSFPRGEGLLPLPPGALEIEHLEAAVVEASEAGSVRVKGVAGPVAMRVHYDESAGNANPVEDADREIPEALRPVLEHIVTAESLRAGSAAESIAALQRFFASGFAYSLQLSSPRASRAGRSLTDFLLRDRKGHCEYFATATVLLLRQAGIPARYAVGYSAQEFSGLERAFVVRNRHAHAWALALVDGHWQAVDTTPANWAEQEAEAARSPFGAVLDLLSWAWAAVVDSWARSDAMALAGSLAIAILVIASPWVTRKLLRSRRQSAKAPGPDRVGRAWREVEGRIGALGYAREPRETVRAWIRRLEGEIGAGTWHASLEELGMLYYRVRFDPAASEDARESFVLRAQAWAASFHHEVQSPR